VRSGIVVDAAKGFMEVAGQGPAAAVMMMMMWFPAWIFDSAVTAGCADEPLD
jgi:hypothetical protein